MLIMQSVCIETKTCSIQGCCVEYTSLEACLETSSDDVVAAVINGPIVQDIYNVLCHCPQSVKQWAFNVYEHVSSRPKRPSWDLKTAIVIASIQAMRDQSRSLSIGPWRGALSQLMGMMTPANAIIEAAEIVVRFRNLPGLLKNADLAEKKNGSNTKRKIGAEWICAVADVKVDFWTEMWYKLYKGRKANSASDAAGSLMSKASSPAQEKVILFVHGGGYISMSSKTHRDLAHKVSKVTGRRVFAFDYRLSPETRFPGALYDTVQAYLYLTDSGIDPKHITLIGDSAGGGLCLALALYLRDHGFPLAEAMVLLSPWVDLTFQYPSWEYNARYDYLPTDIARWDKNPAQLYLGRENYARLCRHPYVSPIYAESFEGLPRMLIQYGGGETLFDEIVELGRKVKGSRTTVVQIEEYEDMPHVFQLLPLDTARHALVNVGRFVSAPQRSKAPG